VEETIKAMRPLRIFHVGCVWLLALICWLALQDCGLGQSRAAEYLKRMDANSNGYIEPSEISDSARPYLERYAQVGGMSLSQTHSLRRWEYSVERYYSKRAESTSGQIDPGKGPSGFELDTEALLLPEFGSAKIRYPYTREDLEEADRMLRNYDRNDDQELDRAEAVAGRWSRGNPYDFDFNHDERISRTELAQRSARNRLAEKQSNQVRYKPSEDNQSSDDAPWARDLNTSRGLEADRNSRYLADSIVDRYDRNRDHILNARERSGLGIDVGAADFNRDGDVSEDELAAYYYREMSARDNDLSDVLPSWFFERDSNGDRQIDMVEFTDQWDDAKVEEFTALDSNRDGILTSDELLGAKALVGGNYLQETAQMLMPRATVVSEIEIDAETKIGDLNVQINITHTYAEQLDAYLIGPDGQRVELFTGVGRSDDHFENTIFDDEAPEQIRSARAPFRGRYQPEALEKKEPGLSHFKGQSLKGVWQLMIRGSRSDRVGILHSWALMVEPADEF
jgi:subtilisin-like proprotein convertase family protein